MSEEKLEEINTIAEFMEKLNKVKELEGYQNLEKRASRDVKYSVSALEHTLIKIAKNEYPTLFSETDNPLDLLIKLQHYGIPTRLLDITTNPLVALYFACEDKNNPDNNDKDGEIFIIGNQYETYFSYSLQHDIAKYMGRSDIFGMFETPIEDFFLDILMRRKQHTFDIDKYIVQNKGKETIEYIINNIYFIYPPRLFERLYLQQGHFILFLNDYILHMKIREYDVNKYDTKKYIKANDYISPIPKDHKNIIARYIIPAESKKHLLDELKMLNITESTLFHDDVDRVCKNIVADFKGRYKK